MLLYITDGIIPNDSEIKHTLNIDFLRTYHCRHSWKFQIERDILRNSKNSAEYLTSPFANKRQCVLQSLV